MSVDDEIRGVLDRWTAALKQRDLDALKAEYAADVRVFDVGAQTEGFDSLRSLWEGCFPYFQHEIGVERRGLQIKASSDLAVASFFSRMTGSSSDHPASQAWMRTTVCFKKTDGQWRIFHDHLSMPTDCGSEKPVYLSNADVPSA